jgi:hypothetical protein
MKGVSIVAASSIHSRLFVCDAKVQNLVYTKYFFTFDNFTFLQFVTIVSSYCH